MSDQDDPILTIDHVLDAADRIWGHVHRTPTIHRAPIDAAAGAEVHLKAEHLQRAGSFKARGAFNRLLDLTDAERARGVVAVSSGNHAVALACAGRHLGVRVDVYMPDDATRHKQAAAQHYGATVHLFDHHDIDHHRMIEAHRDLHGSIPVPAFDDHHVMAGQGTVALELHDQAVVDTVVVPMSGGALMAGCALATRSVRPKCWIVGVEPAGSDATARSLRHRRRATVDRPDTVADDLVVTTPGRLTFPINQELVDEVVTVTDAEIQTAMRLLFDRTKQVVEPSGATALAAVLSGRVRGSRVGVVASGGNIDLDDFARLAGSGAAPTPGASR